jgi:hypothetical protein
MGALLLLLALFVAQSEPAKIGASKETPSTGAV